MNAPSVDPAFITTDDTRHAEGQTSGVSWAAVLAGAVAAASLSLLLLILGFGLGLSAVSPWAYNVAAIGASTVVWLAFTQLIASGLGGYLAGRLRVKWSNVHGDETYFRDTAHGLLAWSIAALMSVVLLASAAHAILGTAISTGETVAGAIAPTAMMAANDATTVADAANPMNYFADMLLRSDAGTADANNGEARREVVKIFVTDVAAGSLPTADRDYLARVVAKRNGINQADAQRRVDNVYAQLTTSVAQTKAAALRVADSARKAAAHSALWMFVALLVGAFVASLAATFGGRQRDSAHVHSSVA